MKKQLFLLMLLLPAACTVSSHSIPQKVPRAPLQKSNVKLVSPEVYEKREAVAENGQVKTYDPQPKVVEVDPQAGRYELRWLGYDGQQKVIVYQRPDAIDLVVKAQALKLADNQYEYSYQLDNLPSSPNYVRSFIVQVFAPIVPDPQLIESHKHDKLDIRTMSPEIARFREGHWYKFANLTDETQIQPGSHSTIKFTSAAPSGLVGCMATGGSQVMKGVGEHLPYELESVLPGYEAYPSGLTIGPVVALATMSRAERTQYLLARMTQFSAAGWLTPTARQTYEQLLRNGAYDNLLKRLDQDLQNEQITSEIVSLMQMLR